VPPSVGFKANRAERRARKRRPGHDGISRRRQSPDVIVRCRPSTWQWVFQTPEASYHIIVPRRNAEVIAAFLGETHPESWVSDLWSPQLQVDAETHQICLAHQIRNLTYAVEADGPVGRVWAIELRHLFGRAIHLHEIRDGVTPASFTRRRRRIENAVDRLVFRTFLPEQPDTANARRLQERYREHRASLFVCFDRPDIPPTNNASEQDLRPSVIHRKVTGGYRSQLGADISAIFISLLTTARKRGENLFQALRSTAGPSPLHAAGLA
jgi:transposase